METEAQITGRKNRANGRYGEIRLSRLVNGVVVGRSKAVVTPDGKTIKINCQKPPDVVTSWASFENKHLKHIPKIIDKMMTQAITNAPEGLIPIGHITDREARVSFFIMTERDFLDLHIGGKSCK